MQTGIDFTARCMAAEATEQINKASTGFADLDTRLDTMDTAIEQAQQAIHFKGFVNYYNDLPANPEENDAYTVLYSGTSGTEQDGTEYVWSKHENTYEWNAWGKLTYSQAQIDNKLNHIKSNQVDGMTGYTIPAATSAITTSDSLNEAVGKLEKGVDINKTNILSIHKTADLYFSETEPTGTIPTGSYWISKSSIKVYGGSISGTLPLTFTSDGTDIISYTISGALSQVGIPTPSTPIYPTECGDIVASGDYQGKYAIPIVCGGETNTIYVNTPICKITATGGNYTDIISTNTVTRWIYKKVFTGQEDNWRITGSSRIAMPLDILPLREAECVCSHYKGTKITAYNSLTDGDCTTSTVGTGNVREFGLYDTTHNTLDGFKTWVQQLYANNTPLTVWYVMSSQTTETITTPIIPTVSGSNTFNVDTTLSPSSASVTYTGAWT